MDEETFRAAARVSRETYQRLQTYAALLARWNPRINLVSPASLQNIWTRHMLDSGQLWQLIDPAAREAADLGSGGGFPAIVLAAIARDSGRQMRFHAVEADARKAAFLNTVVRELDLPVSVHNRRLETLDLPPFDLVTARALGSLVDLMGHTYRLRAAQGQALFLKGKTVHKELDESRRQWNFDYRLHPSLTDPQAAVVEIGAIHGPR